MIPLIFVKIDMYVHRFSYLHIVHMLSAHCIYLSTYHYKSIFVSITLPLNASTFDRLATKKTFQTLSQKATRMTVTC